MEEVKESVGDVKEIERLKELLHKADLEKRAKTAFIASLSYEVRTPINAILGMTSLLLNQKLSPKVEAMLEIIRKNSTNLMETVNNVLDLSNLESGKLTLEEHSFNFKTALKDIFSLYQSRAEKKRVGLSYDFDLSVPNWIIGDSSRLSQVFVNLLNTLLDTAKEEGFIALSVKAKPLKGGRVEVIVTVETDQLFPSKENQKQLKDNLKLLNTETEGEKSALDLEKDLQKENSKFMPENIYFQNKEDKGFSFTFSFLSKEAKLFPGTRNIDLLEDNFDITLASKAPLKILVAEDNPTSQIVVGCFFSKLGYLVDVVSNGAEALEAMEKTTYNMVFLDMKMPVMDGIEAAKLIRKNEKYKNTRLVALTANIMKKKEDYFSIGINDYISKPISPAAIKRAVFCYISNYNFFSSSQNDLKNVDEEFLINLFGIEELSLRFLNNFLKDIPESLKEIKDLIKQDHIEEMVKGVKSLNHLISPFCLKNLEEKLFVISSFSQSSFLDKNFIKECFFDASTEINFLMNHLRGLLVGLMNKNPKSFLKI
jgi:two-component system, sensor histidine kinase